MTVSADPRIGSQIAGYRLDELVGRGGMGVVYRAQDLALDRRVALKILSPELAADVAFRERFLIESRLAASLDHPNVIPVYDAGEAGRLVLPSHARSAQVGELFIAMRYVEGSDLRTRLKEEGALSAGEAIAICQQLANALDAAHARGLVHRDVKPSNVLLDEQGHAYLADFGLTRRLSEQAPAFDAGLSLGTPAYVAPEQIEGKELDGRADQYSLGCLLYECLTGEPPFPRTSEAATLFAHLEEKPPAPPGLEAVIPRALAKDPADRYESCAVFVTDARQALGLEPKRARWPLAIAGIGAALIGAALLAFFLTNGGGGQQPAAAGRLVGIDSVTNKVVATASIGQGVSGVAVGAGHVWATTFRDSGLWRIDPLKLDVLRITTEGSPVGVAVRNGVVYVAGGGGGTVGASVTRFDARSGAKIDAIPAAAPTAVASGPGGVWLAAGDVERLSAGSEPGRVVSITQLPDPVPLDATRVRFHVESIAVGKDAVWAVGDALDRRLWRNDPKTGRPNRAVRLNFVPGEVAVGSGGVWVAAQLDDDIVRVDPLTGQTLAAIKVGRGVSGLAVGAAAVWVANAIDRTIMRIDPKTYRVTATIPIEARPSGIAVGEGKVWVIADER